MIYLGIAIDSTNLTISVPEDKYNELVILLPTWLQKRSCTKQQLLSLIGKLSFICKVVRPGRIFLRRLIDLGMSVKKLSHHININKEAQEDIKWWWEFLPARNRHSLIPESLLITSDDWIQGRWDVRSSLLSIDVQELFAIVAAVFTWGTEWEGKRNCLHN